MNTPIVDMASARRHAAFMEQVITWAILLADQCLKEEKAAGRSLGPDMVRLAGAIAKALDALADPSGHPATCQLFEALVRERAQAEIEVVR